MIGVLKLVSPISDVHLSTPILLSSQILTIMYSVTSAFATIDADIRFTGSTEYSARAFRMALVYESQSNIFSDLSMTLNMRIS